jgi:hypothetical protein
MDTQSATPPPPIKPQPLVDYPITLEAAYPEHSSRLWALGTLLFFIPKLIVLIPHAIILYVFSFVAMVAFVIGQIAVLFTGRYPRVLFNFVVGFYRWQIRVNAFALGLTDIYPPFQLK